MYVAGGIFVVEVTVSVVEPETVTPAGVKPPVAPTGNPLTLKSILPVKPLLAEALIEKVALPPGTIPTVTGEGVRLKSGVTPNPLSEIVCGEPDALSTIETAPAREPAVVGTKTILMAQVAPAAMEVPQLFV